MTKLSFRLECLGLIIDGSGLRAKCQGLRFENSGLRAGFIVEA